MNYLLILVLLFHTSPIFGQHKSKSITFTYQGENDRPLETIILHNKKLKVKRILFRTSYIINDSLFNYLDSFINNCNELKSGIKNEDLYEVRIKIGKKSKVFFIEEMINLERFLCKIMSLLKSKNAAKEIIGSFNYIRMSLGLSCVT